MPTEKGARMSVDQLPVLYLIFRGGAGVNAGGGRTDGVRDI